MNIYLDKVDKDKKDTLYRLLQYSLYEESLNDGNEMNEMVFLFINILMLILLKKIGMHFLSERKKVINYLVLL